MFLSGTSDEKVKEKWKNQTPVRSLKLGKTLVKAVDPYGKTVV